MLESQTPAERLSDVRDSCVDVCARLRLSLHEDKTHIVQTRDGIRFLGFRFQRIDNAVSVRLLTESATRIRRRFAELAALYSVGAVSHEHVRSTVFATLGHARQGHTRALCRDFLNKLRLVRCPRE